MKWICQPDQKNHPCRSPALTGIVLEIYTAFFRQQDCFQITWLCWYLAFSKKSSQTFSVIIAIPDTTLSTCTFQYSPLTIFTTKKRKNKADDGFEKNEMVLFITNTTSMFGLKSCLRNIFEEYKNPTNKKVTSIFWKCII